MAEATQQIPELYSTLSFVSLPISVSYKKGMAIMPSRLFILMHSTELEVDVTVITSWQSTGTSVTAATFIGLTTDNHVKRN